MDNQCLSICMGNDIWDIMDLILYWRMALDYYCWVIFNWTTIYYVYSILDFYSLMNIYMDCSSILSCWKMLTIYAYIQYCVIVLFVYYLFTMDTVY